MTKSVPEDMVAALALMTECPNCMHFTPRGGLYVCNGSMALEEAGPFYPPGKPGECYAGCQWCGGGTTLKYATPVNAAKAWNELVVLRKMGG